MQAHQYIDRRTGRVCDEALIADNWVHWIYGYARENAPAVFRAVTSARMTRWLAFLQFDLPTQQRPVKIQKMIQSLEIDLNECVASPQELNSPRKLFERKIKYWQCRPMLEDTDVIVAPADAKALVGAIEPSQSFFLKEKFFSFDELLGIKKRRWIEAFSAGHFAVFRLTPEKYHYNHLPVSGTIADIYTIDGTYHSCNPTAVVAETTPYSKNRRVVTIIDTDVPGGTRVGRVAMVEVVALMIGEIVQTYSSYHYDSPHPLTAGMFVQKGQPKSLFRPGSSVDVLFFEKERIIFDKDLMMNTCRSGVNSRFSKGFKHPLVETDVQVRSSIGRRAADIHHPTIKVENHQR